MKNTLLTIALAGTGLIALPLAGHAAEKDGFFINGSVGQSDYSQGLYDDEDTAYGVNLGYRWALSPRFAFGVEGGYTNLGQWSPETGDLDIPDRELLRDSELKGWTAGVNAHLNLSDQWYLSGRTGFFRADAEGDILVAGVPFRADNTSNEWYAGAGVGYDFTDNFSLGLNYDYYKSDNKGLKVDPGVLSVNAEARF
jgi:OOP family OmpA-OmpF porin/outer membrane immunogenic protein